jgi:hypothetical protein
MKSYYELLGASADDDAEALKEASRKAAKAPNPDLHPNDPDASERSRKIIAPNALLRVAKQRTTYDWFLQLERESFQLMLKRHQLPLKRMRTIAVIAAVSALIGGYELWVTMPTSGKVEIDKDELAAADGAAVQKQTATVVAAANENENPSAAIGAAEADAVEGDHAVTHQPGSLPPVATSSRDTFRARAASRQLTINAIRLRQTDALLTISAGDVGSDAAVVVGGLAPGSTLSAGGRTGPNMWRLSTKELGDLVLAPPRGFVGGMDLSLELRLADQAVVDRKAIQLEWSAKDAWAPPKSQRLGAAEIALIIEKGAALIRIGNVAGARLMFQYAAEAGDPVAAFALAESFDPLVLGKLNTKGGIAPNVALAQTWYQKAKDLGSAVAPERLERLGRLRK